MDFTRIFLPTTVLGLIAHTLGLLATKFHQSPACPGSHRSCHRTPEVSSQRRGTRSRPGFFLRPAIRRWLGVVPLPPPHSLSQVYRAAVGGGGGGSHPSLPSQQPFVMREGVPRGRKKGPDSGAEEDHRGPDPAGGGAAVPGSGSAG